MEAHAPFITETEKYGTKRLRLRTGFTQSEFADLLPVKLLSF